MIIHCEGDFSREGAIVSKLSFKDSRLYIGDRYIPSISIKSILPLMIGSRERRRKSLDIEIDRKFLGGIFDRNKLEVAA